MRRLAPSSGSILSAVAGGGLVALLSLVGALRAFDLPVGDLFLRLGGGADPAASPVAAIVLDDATLEVLGPLPWPHDRLAALVDAAFEAGARALAVDLVLAAPGSADADRTLAGALGPVGGRRPVVLAAALRPDGGWLLPLDRFGGVRRAAHAEGEIGLDGVVRSILATKQRSGIALPALALAAARLVRPDLPVTPGALLHPSFRLAPKRVPRVDALELLSPRASARDGPSAPADALLRGRLVFLGTTATAATDQFLVPTGGGLAPGVLIHASAAASLLAPPSAHALLHPLPPVALVLACLALAALAQLTRARAGRLRLLHFGLVGVALALGGAASLQAAGLRLPLVTLAGAFGASALFRETAESTRARRQTGRLLRALVEADPKGDPPGVAQPALAPAPRGATGRLALARELQERVIRDRDLRRALLDSLEDGVIRWDESGRVVLANAAAGALWNGAEPAPREPERAAGGRHPAPSRDELFAEIGRVEGAAAAGAAEAIPGQGEALLRRGGHQLRILLRTLEDGGALAVLRDVTAERELEDRRREMQRMVSHELKTPLSSIASFGGMLERYQLSDEELARIAGLIRGESERLLDMVTTFLDLERIGSGRWTGEPAPLDLAAVARERRDLLAGAAEARGLTLDVDGPGPCPVSGDAALLARVIDNLAGNAIKYTPAGGHIRLGVRRGGGEADGWLELTVADDGPGIPAESLPRLFDRFYRVPGGAGAGAAGGGSGLGLALVREIAEWHGGCVTVESETGRGSVFTVRLPALPGSPSEEKPS